MGAAWHSSELHCPRLHPHRPESRHVAAAGNAPLAGGRPVHPPPGEARRRRATGCISERRRIRLHHRPGDRRRWRLLDYRQLAVLTVTHIASKRCIGTVLPSCEFTDKPARSRQIATILHPSGVPPRHTTGVILIDVGTTWGMLPCCTNPSEGTLLSLSLQWSPS